MRSVGGRDSRAWRRELPRDSPSRRSGWRCNSGIYLRSFATLMIGVILACVFFGFGTAVILIEIKNFWKKSASEILSAPGGGSNPVLQQRMRMALPAGALLTGSFFLAAAFAVLSGLGVSFGVRLLFLSSGARSRMRVLMSVSPPPDPLAGSERPMRRMILSR